MAITPTTNLKLLKVPISIDNKNQITFINKETQFEYFNSLESIEYENFNYQRKDSVIRFPAHIDNIIEFNYCMYQNENYSDKWFYCFISDMKYVNDGLTEITIKTDVFQTWQFDLIYKNMFVEREHVSDDTIGSHTVPENLENGEYIINNVTKFDMGEMSYIIQVTEWGSSSSSKPLATNYGGIYYAGGAYVCKTIEQVVNILQLYATSTEVTSDAVYSLYMIPSKFIINNSEDLKYSGQHTPAYDNVEIEKPNNINNYTPVNKKLLTFPYCFLNISNNNGSSNTLQYELFNEIDEKPNKCIFNIKGVPVIGGSIKCNPFNYKNNLENDNEEEGIVAGKFPTLNWSENEFINWITQNGVNIALGSASNILNIIGGIGLMATGNAVTGASSVVSGGLAVANTLAQIHQYEMTPNSAKGNTNAGDINSCSNSNTFYFYQMSIKQEYAKIIDNFFSMYGYKVNNVKIPNIFGRKNWNYVKTLGSNIEGDIPQNDLQEIKNMFDNGVTFWHNSNTFLDYSQENNIL